MKILRLHAWGACEYCWDNPCTCDEDLDELMVTSK